MVMDKTDEMQIQIFKNQAINEYRNLKGNILVISDRLSALALELIKCLENNTDAKIIGLMTRYDYLHEYANCNVDYVIIVGMLNHTKNYLIIDQLRSNNEKLKTVQWVINDACTNYERQKNKIYFYFDRMKPADEFIKYLIEIEKDCDDHYIEKNETLYKKDIKEQKRRSSNLNLSYFLKFIWSTISHK